MVSEGDDRQILLRVPPDRPRQTHGHHQSGNPGSIWKRLGRFSLEKIELF